MWYISFSFCALIVSVRPLSIPSSPSLFSPFENLAIGIPQNSSSLNGSVLGSGSLGIPWGENALADYSVGLVEGGTMTTDNNFPAYDFYNIFLALIGFWREPANRAVIKRIDTIDPSNPGMILTIIPVGLEFTTAIVAAVLDSMLDDLTKIPNRDHPRYESKIVNTKNPHRTIGVVTTRFAMSAPLNAVDIEGYRINGTKTASNSAISVDVSYPPIPPGTGIPRWRIICTAWLANFYDATIHFLREVKSTDNVRTDRTKPLYEGRQQFPEGFSLVTKIDTRLPEGEDLLMGDLMIGMAKILNRVVNDWEYDQLQGIISRDGKPVASVSFSLSTDSDLDSIPVATS